MSNTLVYYPFKNDKKFACIAAVESNGKFGVGWSRCSDKDQFTKEKARQIAIGRAKAQLDGRMFEPHPEVLEDYLKMVDRATKYFKESVLTDSAKGTVTFESFVKALDAAEA